MGAFLSSLNVLRNEGRSFIIVGDPETTVGVLIWVVQLISWSVAPTGNATGPHQVLPHMNWLDLTCKCACKPGKDTLRL
jgi:hypothetical protein